MPSAGRRLHQRASFRAAGAKASALGEAVTQALTVKLLALEADMKRRFERHLLRSAWTGLQSGRIAHVADSLGQALQHLTALVLVYLGARMIVVGDMTVGALVAASILSARALAPMRQLALAWGQFRQAREADRPSRRAAGASAARPAAGWPEPSWPVKGRLRVEESRLPLPRRRSAGARRRVLRGGAGHACWASPAPPGSGKSTLVRLLLGVETPEAGRVLLDGHDLAAARRRSATGRRSASCRRRCSCSPAPIAENIGMGAADRTLARVVAAARFVGADEFIRRLPQGYETVLGERGPGLSLGQRQLLAVARAIVRNPRMLVLDEATSALDPAAEAHLLANIRRAGSGRTVLVVTHRPAVLEACDRVLLLERGRVVHSAAPPRCWR